MLGIVNGTTNFILTAMAEQRPSAHEMLVEAQRLGYAEADPTADMSGSRRSSQGGDPGQSGLRYLDGGDQVTTRGSAHHS